MSDVASRRDVRLMGTPEGRARLRAEREVARAVRLALEDIPCFCQTGSTRENDVPARSPEWCVRHVIAARLDATTAPIIDAVQQELL